VTEEIRQRVPVKREEARIEREPITDENRDSAMAGPEISTAEHEVVLHEEVPVVEKRVVPKERVRLEKEIRAGEEQISEQIRKEHIEAEEDLDR
jgi:stress response protein YsnF